MVKTPRACVLRPRVEGEREAQILDAAVVLLGQVGYDRLTMDAVAAQAKASKATLYRRWSTKAALVVDAILRGEITADLDLDLFTPALAGIVLHRSFVLGLPTDEKTVAQVIDEIILPAATRRPT